MDEQMTHTTETPKDLHQQQKQQKQQKRGRSRSPSRTRINGNSHTPNPNSPVTRSQASRLKETSDAERVSLEREASVALIEHALNNSTRNRPDELIFNSSVRNATENHRSHNNTVPNISRSDETLISDHMRQTSINDTSKSKGHRSSKVEKATGNRQPATGKPAKEFARTSAQSYHDTPRHLYGLDNDSGSEITSSYSRYTLSSKIKKEPYADEENDEAAPLEWFSTLRSQMLSLVDPVKLQSAMTIFGVVVLGMFVAWCLTAFSPGPRDANTQRNAEESRREALLEKHERMIKELLEKVVQNEQIREKKEHDQRMKLLKFEQEQRVCSSKVAVLSNTFQRMSSTLKTIQSDVSQFKSFDVDFRSKTLDDSKSIHETLRNVTDSIALVETKVWEISQNEALHQTAFSQMNSSMEAMQESIVHIKEEVNKTIDTSSAKMNELRSSISSVQAIHQYSTRRLSSRFTKHINEVSQQLHEYLDEIKTDLTSVISHQRNHTDTEISMLSSNMSSLNLRLNSMKNRTVSLIQKEFERVKAEQWAKGRKSLCVGEECHTNQHYTMHNIHDALDMERADTLGMTDYALKSAGAEVHRHSETYKYGSTVVRIFGVPIYHDPTPPNAAITRGVTPGVCWRMTGSHGFLVVKLVVAIQPTMVTLEHLDQKIDRYSKDDFNMAPKECEVFGWEDENGKKKVRLGSFTYEREGSAIQTFSVKRRTTTTGGGARWFRYVELKVLSNYGNQDSTCIYRFRVHGETKEWLAEHDDDF